MTIQCCKCHKVRVNDKWYTTHEHSHEAITHTYCPVCLDLANQEIRAEMARFRMEYTKPATARA